MAYAFVEPILGMLQIANTDAGITPPNQLTTIPTPPAYLGQQVRAFDPSFGEGEFILLAGVAGTAIGALVIYDSATYLTTLCPSTANLARPVAVAMSANVATTTFGWYQISGSATVLKQTTHQIAANLAVGVSSSAGKIVASSSAGNGKEIQGARKTTTGTAASASTTCVIVINRPHMQGRTT